VAIENGHGAEAFQVIKGPSAVLRSPTPFRVHGPQRDVGEDHDRCGRCKAFDVVLKPFELLISEIAKTAGLEIDHVDKADEVDAVLIETVPTRTLRVLAVSLQVGFAGALVDDVVLARYIECRQASITMRSAIIAGAVTSACPLWRGSSAHGGRHGLPPSLTSPKLKTESRCFKGLTDFFATTFRCETTGE